MPSERAAHIARLGWGLWAVEVQESGQFIGFVGLAVPSFEAHFTPCTEVGWRLGMRHDSADDFDHPKLPPGHPLRRHVLYRATRAAGRAGAPPAGAGG